MDENEKKSTHGLLRIIAITATIAGTLVSLGLMHHAGRKNNSVILIGLFAIWVASPFIGLLVASLSSARRFSSRRKMTYILMLVITAGSLVAYSGILIPEGTKPAFIYLMFPLLSWIVMGLVFSLSPQSPRRS